MNLTRMIEETGKRVRQGKIYSERLTNADVKLVLETAVEVMKAALIEEGRIEIQNFAVLEVVRIAVQNPNHLRAKLRQGDNLTTVERQVTTTRIRWLFKPSKIFRQQLKDDNKQGLRD